MTSFDRRYMDGSTWGHPDAPVDHIETHAAHVFLCGEQAYKIKKPLKFPYLDFSTIEKRRAAIEQEFSINRPHAPTLYRSVSVALGEPVLVMRRFDDRALLSNMVQSGQLNDNLAESLGRTVATAHNLAEKRAVSGSEVMTGLGAQIEKALTGNSNIFPRTEAERVATLHRSLVESLHGLLDARTESGLVCRCHGDMHCGNIIVENGIPILFDAIEFNEKIATTDVLYDLAFLLMDLDRYGQHRAANIVLNTYLNQRRRQEDLSALAALPLFLATRAGVRALVTADRAMEAGSATGAAPVREANLYFEFCKSYLMPAKPRLVCIGGLSGTGKTTLARDLAHLFGPPPGAILLRSDVERKAIAGYTEDQQLPASQYTPEASAAVYGFLFEKAGRALNAGRTVILDAVFAKPEERASAQSLAQRHDVPFVGLWLDAPAPVMMKRVAGRQKDASDATPDVVAKQLQFDVGKIGWRTIDASLCRHHTLDAAAQALGFAGSHAIDH
jgi:uncharacterized protein